MYIFHILMKIIITYIYDLIRYQMWKLQLH